MKKLQIFFLVAFMLLLAVPSAFAQESLCEGSIVDLINIQTISQSGDCTTNDIDVSTTIQSTCPGFYKVIVLKLNSNAEWLEFDEQTYEIQAFTNNEVGISLLDLQAGIYKAVVTGTQNEFIGEQEFPVNVTEENHQPVITARDTCGTSTGIVSIFGVNPGTTFHWYGIGVFTEPLLDQMSQGTYYLEVDPGGCRQYYIVNMPSEGVDSYAEDGAPASCGDSGSLFVYIESGVWPFDFYIEDDSGNSFEIFDVVDSPEVISGLGAGNYTITIVDSDGCTTTLEESVDCVCSEVTGVELTLIPGNECDQLIAEVNSFGCFGDSIMFTLLGPGGFVSERPTINDGNPIFEIFQQGLPAGDYTLEVKNLRTGIKISGNSKNYAGCGCDDFLVEATVIDPYGESDCQAIEYEINTCAPNEQVVLQVIPYDTETLQFQTTGMTNPDGTLIGSLVPWGMMPSVSPIVRIKVILPNGEHSISNGVGYPGCTLTSLDGVTGEDIVIYPNPTGRYINITGIEDKGKSSYYYIFAQDGKKLLEGEYKGLPVDISELPQGVYFMRFFEEDVYRGVKKISIIR